jgi:dipeptidyl aminopeptidase/acylaminoacyl peptidase
MSTLIVRRAAALVAAPLSLVFAQGSKADYARSEQWMDLKPGLVLNVAEPPVWIAKTNRFYYRRSVAGGNDFVLVDATTGAKQPAFDHARIAAALGSAKAPAATALTLPFNSFRYVDADSAIDFVADSVSWRCSLREYTCANRGRVVARPQYSVPFGPVGFPERAAPVDTPRVSPDGLREAFIRNHNIAVRVRGQKDVAILSTDGVEGDAYSHRSIVWSPDSKKIAAFRVRAGHERLIHWVESSPDDQVQPKYFSRAYAKPGDVLPLEQPVIFDLDGKRQLVPDNALFPDPYALSDLAWRHDGRAISFEYNQRGHQIYRIIEVDAATGRARAVLSEEPKTFFTYSSKKFRYDLNDGRDVIWMSERDGWNHLYMIDGATGAVKHQITKGQWAVRAVNYVDTVAKEIYFSAGGMYAGKDPYFVHYYRVGFDGTGLVALTEADANHVVYGAPDGDYYVDQYSRVDMPPVTELRRRSDRSLVAALERGNDAPLRALGWKPPEVFVAKGRDGTTDIWGIIIRPTNFDSRKKYPVIENIYAGPHGAFVPKSFGSQSQMQAIAELGFIVVQVDGMGTNFRSKAFHDVAWQNLQDAGVPDRILWHKAIAAKYPGYDISRVGIYGTSAGGQSAMGALLFHPEFYKVAYSAAGCHDNRMDKIWWNEQWMGKLGPQYAAASNVDNAWRLQGKLLLGVGELDPNVDPSSTYQVVNALIKAGKSFDFIVFPGAAHTDGGPYGRRKRNDFFVHNLLGVEPPDRNVSAVVQAGGARSR